MIAMRKPTTEDQQRARYAETAFARMGIPFERAMQSNVVRDMIEAAAGKVADNGAAGRLKVA